MLPAVKAVNACAAMAMNAAAMAPIGAVGGNTFGARGVAANDPPLRPAIRSHRAAGCCRGRSIYGDFVMIAALYVQTNGRYYGLPDVDPWDEARDARLYDGPWPVVAHPPCQRWGQLGLVNFIRWGGEHNRPGNDNGCFAAALASVRKWGGVLEHPAKSRAFAHFGLSKPNVGWQRCDDGGWTCEVWQSAYGHRANKATWLYYCGEALPPELDWSRPRGTHQVGYQDQRGKSANKPTLLSVEAAHTPPAFRDLLLSIARTAALTTQEQP